jgi:hypothetical protein
MMIDSHGASPNDEEAASDQDSIIRQNEKEAAKETLPPWVIVVLLVCILFTVLWIAWLLSLVF